MRMIARHLLSIAILPFTVTVLVPWWLLGERNRGWIAPADAGQIAIVILGAVLLVVGLALFVASLRRFSTEGEGTLAPWDPPRKFVVSGPYRFVRNPMISGVILILLAESALLRSAPLLTRALVFLAGNAVQIPLVEEPALRRRFGASYEEYCRHVGRLVPRLSPWRPGRSA
jgi:protein-S-isoprenylcysteine O-methyltransferase Ste14